MLLNVERLYDAFCDSDEAVKKEFLNAISSTYGVIYWEKCLHHEELSLAFVSRHLDDCCESKEYQQKMMSTEAHWCVKHILRLKEYGYEILTERLLYGNDDKYIKKFDVVDEFAQFCNDNGIEICYCRQK